jgi:hypothetical protein
MTVSDRPLGNRVAGWNEPSDVERLSQRLRDDASLATAADRIGMIADTQAALRRAGVGTDPLADCRTWPR